MTCIKFELFSIDRHFANDKYHVIISDDTGKHIANFTNSCPDEALMNLFSSLKMLEHFPSTPKGFARVVMDKINVIDDQEFDERVS